jgi:hypothetical protein
MGRHRRRFPTCLTAYPCRSVRYGCIGRQRSAIQITMENHPQTENSRHSGRGTREHMDYRDQEQGGEVYRASHAMPPADAGVWHIRRDFDESDIRKLFRWEVGSAGALTARARSGYRGGFGIRVWLWPRQTPARGTVRTIEAAVGLLTGRISRLSVTVPSLMAGNGAGWPRTYDLQRANRWGTKDSGRWHVSPSAFTTSTCPSCTTGISEFRPVAALDGLDGLVYGHVQPRTVSMARVAVWAHDAV